MDDEVAARFDRLETKMDKISEAMLMLARIDEKTQRNQEDRAVIWKAIDGLKGRMEKVEQKAFAASFISARHERVYWMLLSALLAYIGWRLGMR